MDVAHQPPLFSTYLQGFAQIHVQAFFAHAYDMWGGLSTLTWQLSPSKRIIHERDQEHKVEAMT